MLMLASIHGRAQAAAALLALGAFVDMQTKQKRETALHLAAYHGHCDVCTVLLEAQCNIELVNEYNETAHQSAAANKQDTSAALIIQAAEDRKAKTIQTEDA
jgi:ankyrin repeat protein